MMYKTILIATAFTALISGPVLAAGSHDGHEGHHSGVNNGHMKLMAGHDHSSNGSSVGEPGLEAEVNKTIQVITLDTMRYKFLSEPNISDGDVVKFVITNQGQLTHEMSIGDEKEQKAHRAMMRKMPDMEHEDGSTVTIKPGETSVLIWKFAGQGDVQFACNIPGHFEAGMSHTSSIK